ncbi:sulfotransferase [Halomonas elongata]|uniref:Sulfotransferase n=1 Tax=Halomonas elongata (strain ATCC 33173 / DSM 2581 / NBRC 15536 / NCIMB 2198 / 1H9) TaxID=768066 RepID=A0A1R4A4A2_HALED|nr:sulfotransferase [Halomonas elongata]WBF19557.1 sulfotransferase [Halomonas elongata]WPU48421.1 sulfotransferase [Halomonas elongata DSM 2581]SJK83787.1 uncharacterized protein HELO_2397C [Halomonas elongata DSM 2581]
MSSKDRKKEFSRNTSLETFLPNLNDLLSGANNDLVSDVQEKLPKIFIVGPLRSGTTLFTQWLASTGLVGYPTNLLSRFYAAPLVGLQIQKLLTDPVYNFRDEILDFKSDINFSSDNGKTKGALAPNEFWYFWRRFLPYREFDYAPPEVMRREGSLDGLRDELNGLANNLEKPFMLKAMIMNQNLLELNDLFDKCIFVWLKRDPLANIESALKARERQYGDIEKWYSFKIKEYLDLIELDPIKQVAGQIHHTNQSLEEGFNKLEDHKKLIVKYEDFCSDPKYFYDTLSKMIEYHGGASFPEYSFENRFEVTRPHVTDPALVDALRYFQGI